MFLKKILISVIILFFTPLGVFAEDSFEKFSTCEQSITLANIKASTAYAQKTEELFEIKKYSAVAKSKAIEAFDRTYSCHTQAICEAVKATNPEQKLLTTTIGCTEISLEELESTLQVSFEGCRNIPLNNQLEEQWRRCDQMESQSLKLARTEISKNFRHNTSLENQGNLGVKILEMQKRMTVLAEKTRSFSYSFIKVLNDIGCTLPGPSFL